MSYYEDEYEETEEPIIDLKDPVKTTIELEFSENSLRESIDSIVRKQVDQTVKSLIRRAVNDVMTKNWSTPSVDSLMTDLLREKFDEVYPDVVENKVNEFEEKIKNMNFHTRNFEGRGIEDAARKKVDTYIETELKDSVARSKEYIEQFSKNYFANNLFKAMGMMDKMMPTTSNVLDQNS